MSMCINLDHSFKPVFFLFNLIPNHGWKVILFSLLTSGIHNVSLYEHIQEHNQGPNFI